MTQIIGSKDSDNRVVKNVFIHFYKSGTRFAGKATYELEGGYQKLMSVEDVAQIIELPTQQGLAIIANVIGKLDLTTVPKEDILVFELDTHSPYYNSYVQAVSNLITNANMPGVRPRL